jgi:hypothetical protein
MPKKDYMAFDRYINARIKDGTIFVGMNEMKLKEELKNLGIHRVKTIDDGRGYVNNHYPTRKQLDRVEDLINSSQPRQETIDKSSFYSYDSKKHYHAKYIIFFNNKIYKRGQFLPKRYINE